MSHRKKDELGVFDFYKPKNTQTTLEPSEEKPKVRARLQILILSVDRQVISSLTALLKSMYDVYCVKDVGKALSLVQTQEIAVAIADQTLADINDSGLGFLNEVKAIAPKTERILLAAPLDFAKVKIYLNKGDIFKLIKKPFDDNRMVSNINDAVHLYLENSGNLARAAEKLQKLFAKEPIGLQKEITASENPVLVKCKDKQLFDQIKASYTKKAEFVHVRNQRQAIEILKSHPIKSMVYYFESADTSENVEQDAIFLSYLKKQIPYLRIVAVMDQEKTYYQDVIGLLTNNIIFNYVPYNAKIEKICNELSLALVESNRLFNNTILLTWPPLKILEDEPAQDSVGEAIKEVTSKVKEGMLTGIHSMFDMLKKRK